MICDQCGLAMILVGRQISAGRLEAWAEAFVCPKKYCGGYGTADHRGEIVRWPAMTLMGELPLHARIQGALRFRDSL